MKVSTGLNWLEIGSNVNIFDSGNNFQGQNERNLLTICAMKTFVWWS
jgi:hypothetical protein